MLHQGVSLIVESFYTCYYFLGPGVLFVRDFFWFFELTFASISTVAGLPEAVLFSASLLLQLLSCLAKGAVAAILIFATGT